MKTKATYIKKATIYIDTLFGHSKIEACHIIYCLVPHRQYLNALNVQFLPTGKRRKREITEGENPRIVIIDDWGHPEPPILFRPIEGIAFTPENLFELSLGDSDDRIMFDEFLQQYISNTNCTVLADFRGFRADKK